MLLTLFFVVNVAIFVKLAPFAESAIFDGLAVLVIFCAFLIGDS